MNDMLIFVKNIYLPLPFPRTGNILSYSPPLFPEKTVCFINELPITITLFF
jgi:hypothetical protein